MTTPDRLAAAVAQGHEDAVQAWQDEDHEHFWQWVSPAGARIAARLCMTCHRPDPDWLNSVAPAPVSSPAGEDVERVAREEAERRYGKPPGGYTSTFERAAFVAGYLAALSARPVEAREGERLRAEKERLEAVADSNAAFSERFAGSWKEACDERDAALARAEAAEGVIEKVRVLADEWERRSRMGDRTKIAPAMAANALRALLDGDSEGRES